MEQLLLVNEIGQTKSIVDIVVIDLAMKINETLTLIILRCTHAEKQAILARDGTERDIYTLNTVLLYMQMILILASQMQMGCHYCISVSRLDSSSCCVYLESETCGQKCERYRGKHIPYHNSQMGQQSVVGLFVQCVGVDVNGQNKYGWTVLHVITLFDQVWHLPMFDAIALMKNI
jgi:hypothetical protein